MFHSMTLVVNMNQIQFYTKKVSCYAGGFFALIALLVSCNSGGPKTSLATTNQQPVIIQGEAQGTTYTIKYFANSEVVSKTEIDSILLKFDNSLSTYNPNSTLTLFNQSDSITRVVCDTFGFFNSVYHLSDSLFQVTQGAFDPSVFPLVTTWGFGLKKADLVTPQMVDSVKNYVGLQNFELKHLKDALCSIQVECLPKQKLEFNAIAQGYSVDVLANYLLANSLENFMVELGGETKAHGTKPDGSYWKIGIDKPIESGERELKAILKVNNAAVATSGNYRKFYVKNGVKYSHTINPITGYPVNHRLLSATVVHENCGVADALATYLMVIGPEKAIEFLESDSTTEGYLIYTDSLNHYQTYLSKNLVDYLEEIP